MRTVYDILRRSFWDAWEETNKAHDGNGCIMNCNNYYHYYYYLITPVELCIELDEKGKTNRSFLTQKAKKAPFDNTLSSKPSCPESERLF